MIITIDGPAASGKSSVARRVAKELGVYYLHTGLLYRTTAYVLSEMLKREGPLTRELFEQYSKIIKPRDLTFLKKITYDYGKDAENGADNKDIERAYIFFDGKDITDNLYDASLDQISSIVSENKYVREGLLQVQRDIGSKYDIVADGRDCGSVLFPDADYKFYLTADVSTRAQRLMTDEDRGELKKDFEKAKQELEQRDKRDSQREVAPLTIPDGATVIDNSDLTLEGTVEKFLGVIKAAELL